MSQVNKQVLKQLKQKLIKRKLFDNTLKSNELFIGIKKFVEVDVIEYVTWVDVDGLIQTIKLIMNLLQIEMKKQQLLIRVWIRVLIVHAFFQLIIKNNNQVAQKIFPHLIAILSQCHNDLIHLTHMTKHNPVNSMNLFSRSVQKLKRSLSSSSNTLKNLFGSPILKNQSSKFKNQNNDTKNEQNNYEDLKSNQIKSYDTLQSSSSYVNKSSRLDNFLRLNDHNNNCSNSKQYRRNESLNNNGSIQKALQKILLQYIKYLEKLLSDWPTIYKLLAPYIIRPQLLLLSLPQQKYNTQSSTITTHIIWKLFNYFHILSQINKQFLRLCQIMKEIHVAYMLAEINFIAQDLHMLYNPIVEYIIGQIKSINWDEVIKVVGSNKQKRSLQKKIVENKSKSKNKQKSIHKQSNQNNNSPLKSLRKLPLQIQQHIMQLKTMIDQLGNANQVVLFIFSGYYHHKHLYNKKRPKMFLSINDQRFDVVFDTVKRLEEKDKKRSGRLMIEDKSKQKCVGMMVRNNLNNYNGTLSTSLEKIAPKTQRQQQQNMYQKQKPHSTCNMSTIMKYKTNKLRQMKSITSNKRIQQQKVQYHLTIKKQTLINRIIDIY